MALTLSHALAPTFSWTSAPPDLQVKIGVTTYTANLTTSTYRVLLGPSSGAGEDVLRRLQSSINTAIAASGRTVTVTMGTTALVTVAIDSGVMDLTWSSTLGQLLGGFANSVGVASSVATYPPKYFATFVDRRGADWTEQTPMAGGETIAGLAYGVTSGVTRDELETVFDMIPRTPDDAASLSMDQTPWFPKDTHLGSRRSHDVPWGVCDVLISALGRTVGFADGDLQTLRTSTTTNYDLVVIPAAELMAPRHVVQVDGYRPLRSWTTRLVRNSATPRVTRL